MRACALVQALVLTGGQVGNPTRPHPLPRGLRLRGRGCIALAEDAKNATAAAATAGLVLDKDDMVLGAPFGTLPGATALSSFLAKPKVEVVLALPALYCCALFAAQKLVHTWRAPPCPRAAPALAYPRLIELASEALSFQICGELHASVGSIHTVCSLSISMARWSRVTRRNLRPTGADARALARARGAPGVHGAWHLRLLRGRVRSALVQRVAPARLSHQAELAHRPHLFPAPQLAESTESAELARKRQALPPRPDEGIASCGHVSKVKVEVYSFGAGIF